MHWRCKMALTPDNMRRANIRAPDSSGRRLISEPACHTPGATAKIEHVRVGVERPPSRRHRLEHLGDMPLAGAKIHLWGRAVTKPEIDWRHREVVGRLHCFGMRVRRNHI